MQFLLGDFGSGKTTHIITEILSLIKEKKKICVIVPSRKHKDQLLLQLLKQQKGFIGSPILTLTELQKQLIEQLFPIPTERPQTISNFEKFLIISSIITHNSKKFRSFHHIKQRPEIIKMIYRLIHSLREKDIEQLNTSPELEDKIYDIQLILSEYKNILANKNIADPKFEIDLICQYINQLNPDFFPDYVFIDGFVDFTATQFKFIEYISLFIEKHHKSITISLTDFNHSICKQTISHFKSTFPHAQCLNLDYCAFGTVLANAFIDNTIQTSSSLALYEIQAFGKNKEIEYVTNQIKKLCLIDHYSLEDILIITDQQDMYAPLLASALRKANLPFIFGKDDKLSQNPLIIFIKRFLKIMNQELTQEEIEFFAQSNYVSQELRTILSKAPTLIPLAIQGKKNAWGKAFQRQKILLKNEDDDNNSSEELLNLEQTILKLCEKLFIFDPYKNYPITDLLNGLIDLLEFLGVQQNLAKTHTLIKQKQIINMSIAKDYSALLKLKGVLLELKKSLQQIDHGELNLSSFLFFFGIITEETRYRSEIPQKNTLRILNAKDSRGIFAKAVFLLGLNEGEVPTPPKFELFDNFDRNQLNTLSKKILGQSLWNTDIDYFNEQKLSFATALTRATEKIFFSRTPVNEKGVYFNISHFLRRILEKNTCTRLPKSDLPIQKGQNPAIFLKKHPAEDYFELSQLNLFKKSEDTSRSALDSYHYKNTIDTANTYFDKEELPPQDHLCYFGYIPSITHVTQKYVADTVYISPTRLEKLGRCRYQGLWQDFWKLKLYKLPVYKPEAVDYGTLYHNVLELYIKETVDYQDNFLQEDILHKHLEDCIKNTPQSHVFLLDYQYIYTILKLFIQELEPTLRDQQKPLYFELASGTGELKHQRVDLNSSKSLMVFSRIDRVNYSELNKSYSVIDYKKSGLSSYKIYQKTPFNLFQGFLYSELLRNNNKGPINSVSYAFLEKQAIFQEFPGTISKKPLYESIHDFQHFKSIEILRLLELLAEGNFSPFTLKDDIGESLHQLFTEKFGEKFSYEQDTKCSYCDLKKLCLRQQGAIAPPSFI